MKMLNRFNWIWCILIAFGPMILFHELGHFIAARLLGFNPYLYLGLAGAGISIEVHRILSISEYALLGFGGFIGLLCYAPILCIIVKRGLDSVESNSIMYGVYLAYSFLEGVWVIL